MIIAEIGQNYCNDMQLAKDLIFLAKKNGADLAKFQLFDSSKLPFKTDCELTFEQAKALFEYGNEVGIEVFFSVFDVERVKWCEQIGVSRYKVAYSQRNNSELRDALQGKDVIVSSNYGWKNAKYLYCVPHYPAELKDLHLSFLNWRDFFDGFSDHTIGLDAAKIALSLGAEIIEKHFAIDHKTGIDAPWSMTPDELAELVRFSKVVEQAC